ncbi:MAG TPA: metallopeptidase family protein [Ktedonobacterales bacterium]|nr:metallopeptidase family protein [Ktedonobacterales bacterium]
MATSTKRDYYGILGVAPTASDDEIRHAYRRLAKLWHPDRYRVAPEHLREQAERRMRLLTEAHGVLSNEAKRTEYDREYQTSLTPVHHYARSSHAGDGASADRPFYGTASNFVPGSQPPRDLPIVTRNENGVAMFIGLILSLVTVAVLINIPKNTVGPATIILLAIGIASGFCAIICFSSPDLVRGMLLQFAGRAEPPAHVTHSHVDLTPFEALVQQSLSELPEEFAEQMENVMVVVEEEPSRDVLQRVGVKEGAILLGLYQGVPTTKQNVWQAHMPEVITLYQGPIERYCLFSPARIQHQVRATLLHEIAHHFGMDHDEMPIWVKC